MKKVLAFLLAAVMLFALTACGSAATTPPAAETPANTPAEAPAENPAAPVFEKMTINVGHSVSTDHGYHQGLVEFKRLVEEDAGGAVTNAIRPSASRVSDTRLPATAQQTSLAPE